VRRKPIRHEIYSLEMLRDKNKIENNEKKKQPRRLSSVKRRLFFTALTFFMVKSLNNWMKIKLCANNLRVWETKNSKWKILFLGGGSIIKCYYLTLY
jgi:hypothetical protein